MLKSVKVFFSEYIQAEKVTPDDIEHRQRLAAAALLFEVSRCDFEVDDQEQQHIEQIVREKFGLSEEEVQSLVQLAQAEAEDASSLYGFTSLINQHWSLEQRIELVKLMWQVAYADGKIDDHEHHLMRKIQRLLYIPHKRFIGAKIQAKTQS